MQSVDIIVRESVVNAQLRLVYLMIKPAVSCRGHCVKTHVKLGARDKRRQPTSCTLSQGQLAAVWQWQLCQSSFYKSVVLYSNCQDVILTHKKPNYVVLIWNYWLVPCIFPHLHFNNVLLCVLCVLIRAVKWLIVNLQITFQQWLITI